jgi:hypothetical protein
MTADLDPRTESARLTTYPSCLAKVDEDTDDKEQRVFCMYPGCIYRGPDYKDVLIHISLDQFRIVSVHKGNEGIRSMGGMMGKSDPLNTASALIIFHESCQEMYKSIEKQLEAKA